MRKYFTTAALVVVSFAMPSRGYSQHWLVGGNMGLSSLGGSAGFHITPVAELLFNRNISVGSEFSINTQYGAPLIWHPYFKYYIDIQGSRLRPYASVGPVMAMNVPGGPSFGFLFGGGMNIPVAHKLYLSPNVQAGPIFGFGGATYPFILRGFYWGYETYGLTAFRIPSMTILAFSVRAGIRYEI